MISETPEFAHEEPQTSTTPSTFVPDPMLTPEAAVAPEAVTAPEPAAEAAATPEPAPASESASAPEAASAAEPESAPKRSKRPKAPKAHEDASEVTKATPDPSGFETLGLSDMVLDAVKRVGYEEPSPIQSETIPHLLEGRDLLGQAQTGTGKTAAFALPLLCRIDPKLRAPQALVLAPTRELAIQVAEAFQKYASRIPGFQVLPIYGGQGYERQLRPLARGVHVVVGTPGRVMDHMRRGTLDLKALKTLVLDEADEMLRMGFIDDVEWILEQTPPELQIALFSATLPDAVRRIAKRHLKNPAAITIKKTAKAKLAIRQRFCIVGNRHKLEAMTRVLEAEEFEGIIVFVRTKTATLELAERLSARGYSCAALNGDMQQQARERTVERLRSGRIDILIATDIAARGLDVERISHVINFDVPHDTEAYVHRIGRTGRAGRKGEAILFVAPRERRMLRSFEHALGSPIEAMVMPTTDAINSRRISKFKQKITDTIVMENLDFFEGLVAELHQESDTPMEKIAAALAVMAKGDQPFLLPNQPALHQEHDGRPQRGNSGPPSKRGFEPGMEHFRVEVGRVHGVRVSALVGAIANEAGIAGKYIGKIQIYDDHSTVDLPAGMPQSLLDSLKTIKVRNQPLRIRRLKERAAPPQGEHGFKPGFRKKKRFQRDR